MPPSRRLVILAFLAVLALTIAGFAAPGVVGGALLLVVAAGLVVLSVGAWPHVRRQGRGLRVLIAGGLVAVAIAKFVGAL